MDMYLTTCVTIDDWQTERRKNCPGGRHALAPAWPRLTC